MASATSVVDESSPKIVGPYLAFNKRIGDGLLDRAACRFLAEEVEHHARGHNGSDGVDDILVRILRSSSMNRLENTHGIADIAAIGKPHAPDGACSHIAQDVAVCIFSKNNVEALRFEDHLHGAGIDRHVFGLNGRIGLGYLIKHLPHGLVGIGEDMGLVSEGYFVSPFFEGKLKAEPEDALHAMLGEDP